MFKYKNGTVFTNSELKETIDSVKNMLQLQQTLNNNTNGLNWESGINKYNKEIDWFLCINLEAAEAIESTPWKHWKAIDGTVDWDNIKIELVDLYHFLLSQAIVNKQSPMGLINLLEIGIKEVDEIYEIKSFKELNKILTQIKCIASLTTESGKLLNINIDEKHINSFKLDTITTLFAKACIYADLSFEELYSTYIMKNCLNEFRQRNGYKEGTYIKEWNGIDGEKLEDNAMCRKLWNILEEKNYNELLVALQNYYDEFCK